MGTPIIPDQQAEAPPHSRGAKGDASPPPAISEELPGVAEAEGRRGRPDWWHGLRTPSRRMKCFWAWEATWGGEGN